MIIFMKLSLILSPSMTTPLLLLYPTLLLLPIYLLPFIILALILIILLILILKTKMMIYKMKFKYPNLKEGKSSLLNN